MSAGIGPPARFTRSLEQLSGKPSELQATVNDALKYPACAKR